MSVQGGAKFLVGSVGEQPGPPTPIAGSATDDSIFVPLFHIITELRDASTF